MKEIAIQDTQQRIRQERLLKTWIKYVTLRAVMLSFVEGFEAKKRKKL